MAWDLALSGYKLLGSRPRGYPLLDPASTTVRTLPRAYERAQSSARPEVLEALKTVCAAARFPEVQEDEKTLTFASEDGEVEGSHTWRQRSSASATVSQHDWTSRWTGNNECQ